MKGIVLGEGDGEATGTVATGRRLGGNEGVGVINVVCVVLGEVEYPVESVGNGNAVGAGDESDVTITDEFAEVLGVAKVSVCTSLTGACPATPHRSPTRASSFRFKPLILMIKQGERRRNFEMVCDSFLGSEFVKTPSNSLDLGWHEMILIFGHRILSSCYLVLYQY